MKWIGLMLFGFMLLIGPPEPPPNDHPNVGACRLPDGRCKNQVTAQWCSKKGGTFAENAWCQ